ncbi:hypothetical protein [Clostridium sp. DJ247]|uniref:hypothetical protein n=1 Tax=Clostridium sp. DJ247 TaxID=2726188 RepID=UPI00162A2B3C|nr:hypothetical protein [Clostridium sp. DJ247]MBC2581406.1 hypothetical protein [Clostridium sp. DJ247]
MSDTIIITAMVCICIVSIVAIFAILAYLKDKAILKFKNSFKDLNNEIAITIDNDENKNSKK